MKSPLLPDSRIMRLLSAAKQKTDSVKLFDNAAKASYYVLFSSVPFAMLLIMAARYLLPRGTESILGMVKELLPSIFGSLPDSFYRALLDSNVPLFSVALLTLIWSASKGVRAVANGLRAIFGVVSDGGGVAKRWALSFLFTLVFALAAVVAFAIPVHRITSAWGGGSAVRALTERAFAAAYLTLVFLIIYSLTAARRISFLRLLPGAAISGCGWVIYSLLFSLYIENFSSYSNIYGALGAVPVFMLWVHNCIVLLFIGAAVNTLLAGGGSACKTKKNRPAQNAPNGSFR